MYSTTALRNLDTFVVSSREVSSSRPHPKTHKIVGSSLECIALFADPFTPATEDPAGVIDRSSSAPEGAALAGARAARLSARAKEKKENKTGNGNSRWRAARAHVEEGRGMRSCDRTVDIRPGLVRLSGFSLFKKSAGGGEVGDGERCLRNHGNRLLPQPALPRKNILREDGCMDTESTIATMRPAKRMSRESWWWGRVEDRGDRAETTSSPEKRFCSNFLPCFAEKVGILGCPKKSTALAYSLPRTPGTGRPQRQQAA